MLLNQANNTRQIVSILSILKNPMILMGLVSMVLFIGMPKLIENSKSTSPQFPFSFLQHKSPNHPPN